MKTELDYIQIENALGGNQDWLTDPMMRLGGCAAVCACDSSLYFARFCGLPEAYPFDAAAPAKADYIRFAMRMKPYLRPRFQGVNRPQLYIDGYSRYLEDQGAAGVQMAALSGDAPVERAQAALTEQIDADLPVPCLTLRHRSRAFADYQWHWFMLIGYDTGHQETLVMAVTYGSGKWLSFPALWDTQLTPRGGLILYRGLSGGPVLSA